MNLDPMVDPQKIYRNRIDILKRMGRRFWPGNEDRQTYDRTSSGQLIRKVPKRPGRYALRKNTKRARKFFAAANGV